MTFGARARIRLDTIRQNLQTIKERAPDARILAVVKANAYGHGMVPVAQSLSDVDAFGVARLAEARTLRDAGLSNAIVLLSGVPDADGIDEALALDVDLVFHDEAQIAWLLDRSNSLPFAWLKIDTGMHRLGIAPEVVQSSIDRLSDRVGRLGLMTHFASADETDSADTARQLDRFLALLLNFDGEVSIANSAALFGWGNELERLSAAVGEKSLWIRPGLALYGISPFLGRTGPELGLAPAMQFESRLLSVKRIPAGARVGYGGSWEAGSDTVLGILAAGYGDGYTRYIPTGTPVLVGGREVPVVGRVSMDLTAVDLGKGATDAVGDPVVLWGEKLPVERVATHANTIPYQLLTGVTHREAPIYENA